MRGRPPAAIGSSRSSAAANPAGSGSRLSTRNASRSKSKKYPGCTSTCACSSNCKHQLLFRLQRRHADHGRPSTLGLEERDRRVTLDAAPEALEILPEPVPRWRPGSPRPASISRAAASCTGVDTDRYVSQMSSSRASASSTSASGPLTAIHPSLTCGRPGGLRQPSERKRQRARFAGQRDGVRPRSCSR